MTDGPVVELHLQEDPNFIGGLRQMWFDLSNEDGSREAEVSCGAGLGNPYLYLRVERDGESRSFHVDVAAAMRPLIEQLLEEGVPS